MVVEDSFNGFNTRDTTAIHCELNFKNYAAATHR